jgi:nifR3 family TIM-barrel protein
MGKKSFDLLKFHEEERRVGLQIFGEDPAHLVKACQAIERLGADFVDLNMGCPVPKVVSKGAGSAMCKDLPNLARILKAMVESVKIPVTIKIRTGWDANTRNALEVVRVAEEAGVTWCAIHGRTRAQGYSGEADWEFIGEVKAKSKIPIIGNGDLTTAELAYKRLRTYGVDAVLIGRAALRNPFIFKQASQLYQGQSLKIPTQEDYLAFLREQKTLLEESFDEYGVLLHSKKFLAWYSAGFLGASEFRGRVFGFQNKEELWSYALEYYQRVTAHRSFEFMNEPFLMGGHG